MRPGLSVLLSNLVQNGIIDELAQLALGAVRLILIAQRRVLGDVDALCLMPFGESFLLQPRVALDLVHGRLHLGRFDNPLDLGLGAIGDTNGFDLAGVEQLFHCLIGLYDGSA